MAPLNFFAARPRRRHRRHRLPSRDAAHPAGDSPSRSPRFALLLTLSDWISYPASAYGAFG
jgi:hypothetical protein